ncbi:Cytochrome c oxidase subunit 7A2, mitochondrial [Fukomys damarensis]|uniref:Cytochrome c oxidase subunit 7A2, mitochondrial n=1 Tax=Fukomys damarensis TaxID=885580 RepID=A0A091CMV6_FUKDA|nr:Cytochrome c oxidase subunit 7A2, mitochondrial [Fukomys damarensis]
MHLTEVSFTCFCAYCHSGSVHLAKEELSRSQDNICTETGRSSGNEKAWLLGCRRRELKNRRKEEKAIGQNLREEEKKRKVEGSQERHSENKVPQKQKRFEEDNGIPVQVKGGAADDFLYRATMVLTVAGTVHVICHLAVASFPKKPE